MPERLPQGRLGKPNRPPKGEDLEEDVPDEDLFDETVREGPQRPAVFNPLGLRSNIRPPSGDEDEPENGSEVPSPAEDVVLSDPFSLIPCASPVEEEKVATPPPEELAVSPFDLLPTAGQDEGEEEAVPEEPAVEEPAAVAPVQEAAVEEVVEVVMEELPEPSQEDVAAEDPAGLTYVSAETALPQRARGEKVTVKEEPPVRVSMLSYGSGSSVALELVEQDKEALLAKMDGSFEDADEEALLLDAEPASLAEEKHQPPEREVEERRVALEMVPEMQATPPRQTSQLSSSPGLFPASFEELAKVDPARQISPAWSNWSEENVKVAAPPPEISPSEAPPPLTSEAHQLIARPIPDVIPPEEERTTRLSKVLAGLLPIAGVWTSNGVQFFYVHMGTGRDFCVFPEKAVVMELWRNRRLIHVGAAIMSNDWKAPANSAGLGAFGRFVSGGVEVQESDKVAFPTIGHFHRTFQDFVDSCISQAGGS